jgi:hypothetical protein
MPDLSKSMQLSMSKFLLVPEAVKFLLVPEAVYRGTLCSACHASCVASPWASLLDTCAQICTHTPGTQAAGPGAEAPHPFLLRECACSCETIPVDQAPAHFQ